ncbi:hypothetical protein [Flexithrix dorotheae]|uniref:hypothetical protein n=1 Tax=Flexithrix dorotheae TaxID=70993 RepID=UPI0012F88451|nr:hypothetical protein [Flexithrix dorotheae]
MSTIVNHSEVPGIIYYSYPNTSYSLKLGMHFGGYARYQKENSKFRIQAEYLYNMKGYVSSSKSGNYSNYNNSIGLEPPKLPDPSGSNSTFSSTSTEHLHYFSIPLYFYYMPNKFGFGLGPEFSLLGNYLSDYQGEFIDFALNGAVIYKVNQKVELNLIGNYGLHNTSGGMYVDNRNINFQFSIAYQMINLKKKALPD